MKAEKLGLVKSHLKLIVISIIEHLLTTVKNLEMLLATNNEGQVDWQEIPGTEGRYSAGVSFKVEYINNMPDVWLSLHLRQHFWNNDRVGSHGVPSICLYRVYGPDRHRLVDSHDLLQYNECNVGEWYSWCVTSDDNILTLREKLLQLKELFANSSMNEKTQLCVRLTIIVNTLEVTTDLTCEGACR